MSLLTLQRDFAAGLRTEAIAERCAGLAVYRNNYRASLSSCLADTFAKTRDWIGGDAFDAAVARHVARVPPSSWTLDAYPRDFADTLHLLHPDDPEIAELAWLECALGEAFAGPDAEPLPPAAIAAIDWDRAILRFTPTLDMREIATNASALWSAMAGNEMPPAAAIIERPATLIVWRHHHISRFRVTDQEEGRAIRSARSGRSFAALCAEMIAMLGEEDGIALAGALLGRWFGDGMITAITEGE